MGTEDTTQPNVSDIAKAADKKADAAQRTPTAQKPYGAADKEEIDALWAKFGRDKVKAVEGFREMTLGQIANLLRK